MLRDSVLAMIGYTGWVASALPFPTASWYLSRERNHILPIVRLYFSHSIILSMSEKWAKVKDEGDPFVLMQESVLNLKSLKIKVKSATIVVSLDIRLSYLSSLFNEMIRNTTLKV